MSANDEPIVIEGRALTNTENKANSRRKKAGLSPKYVRTAKEDIEKRLSRHETDLAWAKLSDESGRYYRSECRSCVDLLAVYEGADILDKESDDDESSGVAKRKGPKKPNRPNPSRQKISIRAIVTEVAGVEIKLEPNCAAEFKLLKEVDEVVSFQRWLDLRDKARKNLFWLCRLLGKGLFYSTHQYICDQLLQKNFDDVYFPGYTLDDFHEALGKQKRFANDGVTLCQLLLLLEQRGGYKSTINGIDAVQILVNAPDARIMFITAFRHLAKKLAKEIKGYFYLPQKAEPSSFQLLFPEYILTGVGGRSKEPMECPARNLNQKEPSLWVTSMESSSTGDHCDYLKADDIVDPKNSSDSDMREELKFEFDSICLDIVDPWGKIDVTGTRYYTDDWYGTRMLVNEKSGRVAPFRYSCRGAWTLNAETYIAYKKGEITLYNIIDKQLGTLVFPYRMGWAKLRNILDEKKERGFKNQQLNEATDADADDAFVNHFSEDVLRAHCYPKESAPKIGEIFQSWDWAYTDHGKTSDFSVGVTAIVYENQKKECAICILDIVYDKWKASELVYQILSFHKKWNPKRVLIEKCNGAELLKDNIKAKAQLLGSSIINDIWWKEVDTHSSAKSNRVKSLELLLNDDRLHFVNGAWIDEMFKQLKSYNGKKSSGSRKDDVPDALSYIIEFLPKGWRGTGDDDPTQIEREMDEQYRKAMMKEQHAAMFGNGTGYTPPSANPTPAPEPQPDPRRAMMNKLFGGNGMRA